MPQSGYSVRKFDRIGEAVDFLEDNEIVYLNLTSDGGSHFLFYRPLEVLTRLTNVAVTDALVEIMPLEFFGRFDMLRINIHNTDTGATGNAIDQVVIEATYDDDIAVVPVAEYLQIGGEGDNIASNTMKTYTVPGGFAFLRILLGGGGGVTTASISVGAPSAFSEAGGGGGGAGGGSVAIDEGPLRVEDSPHVDDQEGLVILGVRNDAAIAFANTDLDYTPMALTAAGAVVISGTYAEDIPHTNADVGMFVLAVRNDALASLTNTDGDYAPLQVGDTGALYTDVSELAGTTVNVNGGNRDAGTQTVTLADDDPAVVDLAAMEILDTARNALLTTMDVDTGNIATAAGAMVTDLAAMEILDTARNGLLTTMDADTGNIATAAGAMVTDLAAMELLDTTRNATLVTINTAVELIDDWREAHDAPVGADGAMTMLESKNFDGVALPNAVGAEGDAVRPAGSLSGVQYVMLVNEDGSSTGQVAGYDSGTDSNKSFEINPISEHHVEETLVSVTGQNDQTLNLYFDMDGFRNFALQIALANTAGSVTVVVKATLQDDGTAASAITNYVDMTSEWFGVASLVSGGGGAVTAADYWQMDTLCIAKYVHVELVASGINAGTGVWDIYMKKLY
jgi:hypothetical protein